MTDLAVDKVLKMNEFSKLFEGQEVMQDRQLNHARCQLLMPIILVIQEAEIRRIKVQSQLGQIVYKTLSRKTLHKKGLIVAQVVRVPSKQEMPPKK
jgi:hypothetical protein